VNGSGPSDDPNGYHFSPKHSATIEEAHERLLQVHSKTWREVHKVYQQKRDALDQTTSPTVKAHRALHRHLSEVTLIHVEKIPSGPPLLRITIQDLHVRIGGPSYHLHNLPDFLHDQGCGQPRDTEYFLLIPLRLSLSMTSLQATLRDYPLPLLAIHAGTTQEDPTLVFESDIVIAEEVGTPCSVEWWDCVIVEEHFGIQGASLFSFSVPKTIMPVKVFANPIIRVSTQQVTDICWGVSYSPATQDVMRIVETLSSAPRDPSEPLGFWDKVHSLRSCRFLSSDFVASQIRLAFHWKIIASFKGDVHFHMKGLFTWLVFS
jgi:RNA pol II promoter Fmp27 protein domain